MTRHVVVAGRMIGVVAGRVISALTWACPCGGGNRDAVSVEGNVSWVDNDTSSLRTTMYYG